MDNMLLPSIKENVNTLQVVPTLQHGCGELSHETKHSHALKEIQFCRIPVIL